MTKIKNHSGASKRFKKISKMKYKHKQSNVRHILTKKSQNRKRRLRGLKFVDDSNVESLSKMLPN